LIDTETVERMTESKTSLIDEFLERHGVGLPGHVIDFALDVRVLVAELEDELEALREPEPVG